MFNYSNAKISQLIVHKVGNKGQDDPLELSTKVLKDFDRELRSLLVTYFLSAFRKEAFNHFYDVNDLSFNKVYISTKELISGETNFKDASTELAKHLYASSEHPMIKPGEFYMVHFEDCVLDDEVLEVIGLFKSESKESFLTIIPDEGDFEIGYSEGIDIRKLDKGCLIFNTEADQGFKVLSLDLNSSVEAKYWKDSFLGIQPSSDNYHNTEAFLSLTKAFISKEFGENMNSEKIDQADLLNRSYDFFKDQEHFDESSFKKEVFQSEPLIESFDNYKDDNLRKLDIELSNNFSISPEVVKKKNRVFKSVIKLDKNFHVYIHGNRELIEKGEEPDGRKYYKIYFENET